MTASVRSTSTYASAANDTSVAVVLPTGWQAGDVCYVFGELRAATGSLSTGTAGWTTLVASFASGSSTSSAMALFRRVLQAGDTAGPTITCTSGRLTYVAAAVQGADGTTPEDGAAIVTNNNGASASSTITANSITPAGTTDLLLCGYGCGDPTTANTNITFSTPAGMTIAAQVASVQSGATDAACMVASLALTTNAATSAEATTTTTSPTNNAVNGQAITLVVRAAAGGTAVPLTDSGAAAETLAVTSAVPVADAGAAADTLAAAIATAVSLTEAGHSTETLALAAIPVSLSDLGAAADTLAVTVLAGLAEAGAAADMFTGPPPLVTFGTALAGTGAAAAGYPGAGGSPSAVPGMASAGTAAPGRGSTGTAAPGAASAGTSEPGSG